MNSKQSNPEINDIRSAVRDSLPEHEPSANPLLPIRQTYVPPSHVKALQPGNIVVVGMRGAGKTFWTKALSSEEHQKFVRTAYPDTKIQTATKISVGFRADEWSSEFPNAEEIAPLSQASRVDDSYASIWRTVLLSQMGYDFSNLADNLWMTKYRWVKDNPEIVERFFRDYDNRLLQKTESHLILFDALDRLASTWKEIRPLAKSLFQIALKFQSYRSIHLKLFVRPDMLEDDEITAFPDASKLQEVPLNWSKVDLYALFFQSLANADGEGGRVFRDLVKGRIRLHEWEKGREIYILPDELRQDEDKQKIIFEEIVGEYMAQPSKTAHKRGFPYTWLPNHLMDGRGGVSPRSFCVALREAADAHIPESSWKYPLHYKGIQVGVQKASEIRVKEIKEDYPWVPDVFAPCRGSLSVPVKEDELFEIWKQNGVVKSLRKKVENQETKLPPQHLDEGEKGLLRDLEPIGVVSLMEGGKVQMPDVYRVAFGISRRGGVRPLK